jgi:hypothetical protein
MFDGDTAHIANLTLLELQSNLTLALSRTRALCMTDNLGHQVKHLRTWRMLPDI